MVEKEVAQLKFPKIYLITNELELTVFQELISGKPGMVAAGTFLKHGHVYTNSSCYFQDRKHYLNLAYESLRLVQNPGVNKLPVSVDKQPV